MAQRKKRRRGDKIIITISVIAMILSIGCVAAVMLMNTRLFDESEGGIVSQPDLIQIPHEAKDKWMNFLVVGVDESESLTDIIMVVSFDIEKQSVEVLQIPRDSYVGNVTTGKINAVYSNGDQEQSPINRLITTINTQFGLPITHYVTVTIDAFKAAVDAMGGIEINMPYSINQDGYIIPEGEQVLDGRAAEILVRHRSSYSEGDIGRIKATRLFIAAAFAQAKEMGITDVAKVMSAVYGEFSTDMTINEILDLADEALNIDMANVNMHMLPGEGVGPKDPLNPSGLSVWSIHEQETVDLLNTYFRPYSDEITADQLDILELKNSVDFYSDENTQNSLDDYSGGDGVLPN